MSNLGARRAESLILPAEEYHLLSIAAPNGQFVCPPGTRGLLIGTAGPLNCVINGQAKTGLPVQAGVISGFFESIEDSAGLTSPAENIWAIT